MVKMEGKAVVIGSLNYDIILKTDRMPYKGETHQAKSAEFCCGGKGGNQAVQCARLGIKTYMAGNVGMDVNGLKLLEGLQKYGVDTEFVKRINGSSGMGVVHTLPDGSVYASITRGANYSMGTEDIDGIRCLLDEHTVVILQMEIPEEVIRYAIETAAKAGCTILFNMAPAAKIHKRYMKLCGYLIMNEVEAEFYTGEAIDSVEKAEEALKRFAGEMGNVCIFTLGSLGAVACKGERLCYKGSYPVAAVETTGAGDSFVGGLAYGILNHMELEDMLDLATCCSALTVQDTGAQDSMPDIGQVLDSRNKWLK